MKKEYKKILTKAVLFILFIIKYSIAWYICAIMLKSTENCDLKNNNFIERIFCVGIFIFLCGFFDGFFRAKLRRINEKRK